MDTYIAWILNLLIIFDKTNYKFGLNPDSNHILLVEAIFSKEKLYQFIVTMSYHRENMS